MPPCAPGTLTVRLRTPHGFEMAPEVRRLFINWWMVPAMLLVVWRAWASGQFLWYLPLIIGGLLLGIWLNRRDANREQEGPR